MNARSAPKVLVTRPAHDAVSWVSALQQAGFVAEALPLISIAALSGAEHDLALQQAWANLADYSACMFVSGNAVEAFFRPQNATRPMLPPKLRFMAPGPGTVAALLAAGVALSQIDAPPEDAAQFDSESLWRVVGKRNWQGLRVLLLRGVTVAAHSDSNQAAPGRDWLVRQLLDVGASVDQLLVYARRAPVLNALELQRVRIAAQDGSVWLMSSSEALANLLALDGLQDLNWQGARAIATHERIAAALRAAGWGVVVASRPALIDIVDALGWLESPPNE
ncbi:Uroporphyrinogen-III synthase [Polaromonas vacuolata]|uniref:Uroporphyrinogen-III synthase n=1 Tax=Polaromonas vacuolata TaxID=37448 RepID=A0A6H2H6K3_9BURK|nr:uroporphyrinogen-III synthase [Polaromonas vacuolata]QJC55485.1 Uroporphyrinogen-III synthase [Polaromonas vacuolata]